MNDVPHNVPIPDPSRLTTEQLRHELGSLRALIEGRLDAMDRAAVLLATNVARVPNDTDKQISHLRGLHEEKFLSVQTQFRERDERAKASEAASAIAVNAALQAQKEAAAAQNNANSAAITKSEAATADQIRGILAQLGGSAKATDDKISVINGRLDRGEGAGSGRASNQATMLAVGAVVVSMVIGGLGLFLRSTPTTPPTVAVGIDSKRVDDLVARLDSQSRRLDTVTTPPPK